MGIASGAGPFQLVPGALDGLDDNDRAAVSLLADDRAAAAAAFAAGFEPLARLARVSGGSGVVPAFEDLLSSRDSELLADQRFAAAFAGTMHEALRQGTSGAGWDNVSWIGDWDIDLSAVHCTVLLWYGRDDRFAPPADGLWLSQNLLRARLVWRGGEAIWGSTSTSVRCSTPAHSRTPRTQCRPSDKLPAVCDGTGRRPDETLGSSWHASHRGQGLHALGRVWSMWMRRFGLRHAGG